MVAIRRSPLVAALLAGVALPFAGSRIAGGASHSPVPYAAHARSKSRLAGRDPNTLPERQQQHLVNTGTHFLKAGRLRSKHKLTKHLPAGVEPKGANGRNTSAIATNGIRGASGGGRIRGEACVTLCKRKQRGKRPSLAARWGR